MTDALDPSAPSAAKAKIWNYESAEIEDIAEAAIRAYIAAAMPKTAEALDGLTSEAFVRRSRDNWRDPIEEKPVYTIDDVTHPDDAAVDRFAAAMKAKLSKKRSEGRCGWENKDECSADFLSDLLRGHVEKGDPVDVANLAMMLHQRGERISTSPATVEVMAAARGRRAPRHGSGP